MRARFSNFWENVSASLWFIPSLLSLLALGLAVILVRVDAALASGNSGLSSWLFSGTADAARTVLSAIAGSLITVVSIAFSLTIIAIQQASSQFSPRVLRQFTANRSNQIVIGAYIATFIYALIVLRSVRSTGDGPEQRFVPALSITVALLLAVVCLGLLIYFIHHVSQSLQVSIIMDRLRSEVIDQLDQLELAGKGELSRVTPSELQRDGRPCYVRSQQAGFIRRIDEESLYGAPFGRTSWAYLWAQVGDFVPSDGILAEVGPGDDTARCDELLDQVRAAFVIDIMRSINQDPMFGIRQLADIALKALSPGINDPTTAEHALFQLGDILGHLARRGFPPNVRVAANGITRIITHQPVWNEYVDAALSQIRRTAADDVQVTSTLLRVLHNLALQLSTDEWKEPVRRQLDEIRWQIDQQSFSPHDKRWLTAELEQVERALDTGVPAWEV